MTGDVGEREGTAVHAAILGGLKLSGFIQSSDYCLIASRNQLRDSQNPLFVPYTFKVS